MANEQGRGTALLILRQVLLVLFNLIFYSLVLFALAWGCKSGYQFAYEIFGEVTASQASGKEVHIVIDESQTPLSAAKELKEDGVIVNAYSFYIRMRLEMADKKVLQPGEYTLTTSMTYEEILDLILKSETQ